MNDSDIGYTFEWESIEPKESLEIFTNSIVEQIISTIDEKQVLK